MVEMMSLCSAVHHALPVRIVRSPWNVYNSCFKNVLNSIQKCIGLRVQVGLHVYVHVQDLVYTVHVGIGTLGLVFYYTCTRTPVFIKFIK